LATLTLAFPSAGSPKLLTILSFLPINIVFPYAVDGWFDVFDITIVDVDTVGYHQEQIGIIADDLPKNLSETLSIVR
jgi:hypothetical protein